VNATATEPAASRSGSAPLVELEAQLFKVDPSQKLVVADESATFTIDDSEGRLVLRMPARATTARTLLRRSYRRARRTGVGERAARRMMAETCLAMAGESIGWSMYPLARVARRENALLRGSAAHVREIFRKLADDVNTVSS
jgi:hypothetical protein